MHAKVTTRSGTAERQVDAPPQVTPWETLLNLPVAPAPVKGIALAEQPALAPRPEGGKAPKS